jgi:hypothetical protein
MVNIGLWVAWYFWWGGREDGGFPWVLFPTFGWGIGLFSHFYETFINDSERRSSAIDRQVERELERRRARQDAFEKPKRQAQVSLGEDGELVYDDDTKAMESEEQAQPARRRRN